MKVMLAPREVPSPDQLRFPLLCSPKLDGVRAVIVGGVVMSRSMKPLPNKSIQQRFGKAVIDGLDGELIVGPATDPNVFQHTMSGVMSVDGSPMATFCVFDYAPTTAAQVAGWRKWGHAYDKRLARVEQLVKVAGVARVEVLRQTLVTNAEALEAYEAETVAAGYEGVIARSPTGPYKLGRCTLKEANVYKIKRFEDFECEIIGYEEEKENTNEAKRNAAGRLERSSAKAGKVGKDTLGALHMRRLDTGVEFRCGTGFSARQRAELWAMRNDLPGRIATCKSFPHGVVDKPRHPVFKGLRSPLDT